MYRKKKKLRLLQQFFFPVIITYTFFSIQFHFLLYILRNKYYQQALSYKLQNADLN